MPLDFAAGSFPLATAITWMARLAGLAAFVNAVELLVMRRDFSATGVWRADTLAPEWGALRFLANARLFVALAALQVVAAISLMLTDNTQTGAIAALVLAATTLHAAARFRGTVNGGSDGMLFTVLGALAIAQWESAPELVREGAVLYVAAQLTLSYVRAGLVKVRERSWWNGEALRGFLALPAYGVPSWMPRSPIALRLASVGVMGFECLAPIAWLSPIWCAVVLTIAVGFHAGAAIVFGLNRFLLAWGAAMPALWYAAHRGV